MKELRVTREVAGEDLVTLRAWLVQSGTRVEVDQEVVELTTSKASFLVQSPFSGFLAPARSEGETLRVGDLLAWVSEEPRQAPSLEEPEAGPLISQKARELLQQHQLSPQLFAQQKTVRARDVEDWLRQHRPEVSQPIDWEALEADPQLQQIRALLAQLRQRLKLRFQRHVPLGTLLHDRWQLGRDYGFGEGTSVYDECLILGQVKLGRNCWVGPYTVLDGSGGLLTLGDHCQVGTGCHLYTHNTIENCLSGGLAPKFCAETRLGRCCFLSPHSVIAAGTHLGDHCFVAAGSFVEGQFPSFSYLAGSPARRVGRVEVEGNRARLLREVD